MQIVACCAFGFVTHAALRQDTFLVLALVPFWSLRTLVLSGKLVPIHLLKAGVCSIWDLSMGSIR